MAAIFQIRRGSGSVELLDGELYLHKGSGSLQISFGDDNPIGLVKLDESNSGSINILGNITASNAYFSGDVSISGNLFLGNNSSDNISALGVFTTDLNAATSNTYNIGSTSSVWRNIFANSISASVLTGSLFGMGDPTSFSTSVDLRLDKLEASSSLYDNAMSGSNRIYVSPSGSDSNDGLDPSTPFRTIKAAVESLGSAIPSNVKRYTIFVGSGNYTEQNPIAVPPGVAIVGDTLRTVRLTPANPTKDFFHVHDSNYFYGLRFLDMQHPAFCFSFPASLATATISGGSISSINLVHSLSGYSDGNNQDIGIVIEGPDNSGSIATATVNVSGGVITQINVVSGGTNYGTNEKPHISIPAPSVQRPIITTSPYVQNCSSITGPFNTSGVKVLQALPYDEATYNIDEQGAGGGIRVDGNLVALTSPLESFVADAFTQVNQGGPGHLVINKGYAQFVSCFTTFCTYGFKVANGGFANVSNSVIDFGKYGLISKTYFPQTYNTGSSLETKTSVVSGFEIDENGAGYTGSVAGVTITGGGAITQATAQATVNANGSIDEIVLLTSGSGYTTQPSVTIDAPTGMGGIQATTVNNKALISGVSQILMSLQSGSRGIDISSNMVLNGVDYLVTDVAEVVGQPDQRRVSTYPAPPSINTNDQINFFQLSNISTGGMVMEYVGSGVTYNALPKYGGVPVRTREINEFAPGRVFYSTIDNIGNLKIGDFFAVNQLTGEVTIEASAFNLSGLNAIGPFKRNGVGVGVILQEVSNNTTLLNSQGLYGEDTAPTQYAVYEFVSAISESLDDRIDLLEISSASINSFTQSANIRLNNLESVSASNLIRLNNLESKSASVDVSVSKLNSYTASLNTAIQLTGSTVSFLGDIVVYGTQSIINSENLAVSDNIIYLNNESINTNPDLGIVGNYNDGTYAHTGIYRDSSDGVWRVFKSYTPEPSGNIDLSHASYRYADFYANALSASTLSGIGNITTYSTSVDSRLINLENKSGSVDVSVLNLNLFSSSQLTQNSTLATYTGSVNTRLTEIGVVTGSLISSASAASISISNLNTFSGNVNIRFDNLQTYTTSVNSRFATLATYTGSVDTRLTEIGVVTGSLISSASAAKITNDAQDISITNINSFSASVLTRLTEIGLVTGSLISSASSFESRFVTLGTYTASVEGRFTAIQTFTGSTYINFSQSVDDRLDGVEYTASLFGGGLVTQLNALNQATASLQSFTGSANTRFTEIGVVTGSLISSASSDSVSISNINSFTSSINTTIKTRLNAESVISGSSQVVLSSTNGGETTATVQFGSLGIGTAASGVSGEIRATGDIVAFYSSDERLKQNIIRIPNALEKVESISGNTYDWKQGFENIHSHTGTDIGVIAQEIEKVLPQAVIDRETGYKAVNYEKIVPLLIEAIKELSNKIKELENK